MKKYLLLLIATFAFQFGQAQEFHFTPKIGMSFANLTNTDGSMAPGLNIGIAAEFPVFENFAIEPGIYYSMQGMRSDAYVGIGDMLVDGELTYDMDYVNIPIYAKYYVYDGFYLFAGPQFGFNVQSSVNADAIDFEGSGEDMDIKDIVKVFDFSIGNPNLPAPPVVRETLLRLLTEEDPVNFIVCLILILTAKISTCWLTSIRT